MENLTVEQFGLLGDEAQVAQRMIGFDAERPDLRATDDWFRCFNDRHGTELSLRGVAAQVHFPVVNGSSFTTLFSDCLPIDELGPGSNRACSRPICARTARPSRQNAAPWCQDRPRNGRSSPLTGVSNFVINLLTIGHACRIQFG